MKFADPARLRTRGSGILHSASSVDILLNGIQSSCKVLFTVHIKGLAASFVREFLRGGEGVLIELFVIVHIVGSVYNRVNGCAEPLSSNDRVRHVFGA